jgi:hypothetical protein
MPDKPISPLRQRMIDDMTATPFQREGAEGLRPARQVLRGLPWPVAGHGHERGPSPLSATHGAAADQRGVHQRRHRRVAVLLHRDARTARPRSPSEARERAAQGPGRSEQAEVARLEVADEQGRWAVSRLHGPEAGLVWTTITALGAAQKALNGAANAGYQTPASALGKDFVLEGEGVTREDVV